MANNLSDYLEAALLNWLRGTAFPSSPASVYLALFTTAPGEDGTGGTEVSGGSYARQTIAFGAPAGQPPVIANSGTITFPDATGNWGTITAIGIYSAVTAGNLLIVGPLTTSRVVNSGDRVIVDPGQLTFSVD